VLVLVRKTGEQVVVNGELVITVLECTKGQIRLGFEAPHCYQILRRELADVIGAENRQAAATPGSLHAALDLLPEPADSQPIRPARTSSTG
jgi:carbon storage regulator